MRCPSPSSSPAAHTSFGLDRGMMRSEASGTPARWSQGVQLFAGAPQLELRVAPSWCKGKTMSKCWGAAVSARLPNRATLPTPNTPHSTLPVPPHLPHRRGASGTGLLPSSSARTPPQCVAPPAGWWEDRSGLHATVALWRAGKHQDSRTAGLSTKSVR